MYNCKADGAGVQRLAGYPVQREPHQTVTSNPAAPQRKEERHRGRYKTSTNSVAAFGENGVQIGTVFETASLFAAPFDPPRLMAELLDWVAQERGKAHLHPLPTIACRPTQELDDPCCQPPDSRQGRALGNGTGSGANAGWGVMLMPSPAQMVLNSPLSLCLRCCRACASGNGGTLHPAQACNGCLFAIFRAIFFAIPRAISRCKSWKK